MRLWKRLLMLLGAIFLLQVVLIAVLAVLPADMDAAEREKFESFLAKATSGEMIMFIPLRMGFVVAGEEPADSDVGLRITQRARFDEHGIALLREGLGSGWFETRLGIEVMCFVPRHALIFAPALRRGTADGHLFLLPQPQSR